ncbi:MAG: hypothetical protein ACOC8N_04830 [Spirochaetota bacterium]
MRTILIILVCTLLPLGAFAGPYSSEDLQKDFQQAYELTRSIYTESAQAGEVMSRTFTPPGPRAGHPLG